MTNFSFLSTQPTYTMFAPACIEAKRIFAASPAMCAVGCRKELELAVKWVYAADTTMQMSYMKLFNLKTRKELMDTINSVRENAVKVSCKIQIIL